MENFRPDVKERLGIGYEALRKANPRIILASISGFGQTGPYRLRAGFDQIAQGMGGLMWVTGFPGERPDARRNCRRGIRRPGFMRRQEFLSRSPSASGQGLGNGFRPRCLQTQIAMMDFQAARYLVDTEVPGQAGNEHPYSTPMGVMKTANGYINIGVGGDGQWRALCKVAGARPILPSIQIMQRWPIGFETGPSSCHCSTQYF